MRHPNLRLALILINLVQRRSDSCSNDQSDGFVAEPITLSGYPWRISEARAYCLVERNHRDSLTLFGTVSMVADVDTAMLVGRERERNKKERRGNVSIVKDWPESGGMFRKS